MKSRLSAFDGRLHEKVNASTACGDEAVFITLVGEHVSENICSDSTGVKRRDDDVCILEFFSEIPGHEDLHEFTVCVSF